MTGPDDGADLHLRAVADVEEQMSELASKIRESMRDAAAAVHPAVTPFGLKLLRLTGRSGPVHMSRVADQLFVERSAVSRQVRQLEELGLIVSTVDPDDGRARFLSLTPLAEERMQAVGLSGTTALRTALSEWQTDDLRRFSSYLERLRRAE